MQVSPVLFLLAILGFIGGVVWLARVQTKKEHQLMLTLAQRMNLRVVEHKTLGTMAVDALEGELSGRVVRYWTYTTGSGKSRVRWVAVGMRPRQHGGLEFELSRQGFGAKVAEWFGIKEVQVGDPQFDAAWFIKTNQPEFFAAALVPEIRAKFPTAHNGRTGTFKLADGVVQYVERGYFQSEKTITMLESQLPVLQDLADVAEVFASTRA